MPKEEVFVMLKPDAIRNLHIGNIIAKIESDTNLKLEKLQFEKYPSKEKISDWYDQKDKHSKSVYPPKGLIVDYLTSGPLLFMVWSGEGSLEQIRKVVGNETDPQLCACGTVRRDYGCDSIKKAKIEGRAVQNLVHASKSYESAKREIQFWFG